MGDLEVGSGKCILLWIRCYVDRRGNFLRLFHEPYVGVRREVGLAL